jgi:hypothetical protein
MSNIIADVMERKEIQAYVTFHKVAVEDTKESKRRGYYVARDVDYVHVTPPYSKDVVKFKVETWMESMKRDVTLGKLPKSWYDSYMEQYAAWQKGQEMPLKGTPIRGWGLISPAQQETLIRMNILTVQDLCRVNDEGIRRIGMGAVDLKNKALAWLAQIEDKGPLAMENADLKKQIGILENQVAKLEEIVAGLRKQVRELEDPTPMVLTEKGELLPDVPDLKE